LLVLFLSCGGKPGKPDILLVTLDTTRWDYLSCYGKGRARTPHMDAVARDGVLFTNAFTTVPVTLPAHTSLLTGLYPPSHGVRNNGMYALDPDVPTLAGILSRGGYRTSAVIGAFVLDSQFGLDAGFGLYEDQFPGGDGGKPGFAYAERNADSVTDKAIALFESESPPSFFWVHYFDPHYPYAPPPDFAKEYPGDPYAGEVAYVDDCVGRLLRAFEDRTQGTDPLIVIVGDHGEDLGDHGEMSHGVFLYDSTVRIPLIVCSPGRLPAGVQCVEPVSIVDLFPTILAIAGIGSRDLRVEGRSILPLLEEGTAPERPLYLETLAPFENMGWSPLSAVIAAGFKYIKAPTGELYDLEADPGEEENLLAVNPQSGGEMSERMEALLDSLDRTFSPRGEAKVGVMDEETRRKLESLGYVVGYGDAGEGLKDPKDMLPVLAEEQKGLTLHEAGEYAAAEDAFAEALAHDPTNVTLLNYRGLSLFALGRMEEARAVWHQALLLSPGYLNLRLNLGMVQLAAGEPDSALASYEKVLATNPRYVQALVGKGRALRAKGRHAEAEEVFAQAVEYSPGNAEARFWRGISKKEGGDATGALRELEEASRLDPALEEAARERAMVLADLGRLEEAREILEELASGNTSARRFVDLGYVLERAGRLDEALRAYMEAARLAPDSYMAHNNAGSVLDRLGRIAEAENCFRRALAIKEDFPEAHYNLGFLQMKLGRREEARRSFTRFLELWRRDDEAGRRARDALADLR
jgi:arylsulfatase A-like enzyme/Flp pilus assembly protein TadD